MLAACFRWWVKLMDWGFDKVSSVEACWVGLTQCGDLLWLITMFATVTYVWMRFICVIMFAPCDSRVFVHCLISYRVPFLIAAGFLSVNIGSEKEIAVIMKYSSGSAPAVYCSGKCVANGANWFMWAVNFDKWNPVDIFT